MTRASLRSVGDDVAWLVTREVPPDVDAFYLGVEPFCMQCSAAVSISSSQVQSHLFMCSLFQRGRQLGVCIRQQTALTIVIFALATFRSFPHGLKVQRFNIKIYRMRGVSDQDIIGRLRPSKYPTVLQL